MFAPNSSAAERDQRSAGIARSNHRRVLLPPQPPNGGLRLNPRRSVSAAQRVNDAPGPLAYLVIIAGVLLLAAAASPEEFTLSVLTVPAGGGEIHVDPPLIFPETSYAAGTDIRLTPIVAPGYMFLDYQTEDAVLTPGPNQTATFSIERDTRVLGGFQSLGGNHAQFPLEIEVVPSDGGRVVATPPPLAGDQYQAYTDVELMAVPESGYTFRHWTGSISALGSPIVTRVGPDEHIVASFSRIGGDDAYEPNDSIEAAQPIRLTGPVTVLTDLAVVGNQDWYRLELPPLVHMRVDLLFEQSAGDLNMQLWDRRTSVGTQWGAEVANSYTTTDDEAITYVNNTAPKVLYLQVYGEHGVDNPAYGLEVSLVVIDDDFDRGVTNNVPCDTGIQTIALDQTYEQLVLRDDDYYLVDTSGVNSITIRADHFYFSGDLHLMVLEYNPADCGNAFDHVIAGSFSNDARFNYERIENLDVSAYDKVLVRVFGFNRQTNFYDLTVTPNN